MCSNDLIPDFEEIFDNETSDINSDLLQDEHLLWGHDLLNSHEFTLDQLNDNLFDNINDKVKGRLLDFDCNLSDFGQLLKESYENQQVKIEPTNSVSSSYLTDDSCHTSSANSSPVSIKVRKRNYATLDACSDHSIPLHDERVEHPAKTTKIEFVKTALPPKIYKLTKDVKSEPIYINSVSIRQNKSSLPYIVHKLPSGIKTVNILSQKYPTEKAVEIISNNSSIPRNSLQLIPNQDQEFLAGDLYNSEVDRYSDYRARSQNYHPHSAYGNISQSNTNKTVFQSIPQVGPFHLTEEEKRTLLAEGYSIPTRLPLTKQDERNLKKVRRKIKNKVSAQESRRKKKEYLDAMEKKMESYEVERVENKRRVELLENTQRSLYNQIRYLQQQLLNKVAGSDSTTSTGLMLFMMCFTLLLVGGTMPSSYNFMNGPQNRLESSASFYHMGYGTSRSIFNYSDQTNIFQDSWPSKLDTTNYQSFTNDGIIRRQSILLGDDNNDDLLLSYVKNKPVYVCYSSISHNDSMSNQLTLYRLIDKLISVNIVK